MGEDAKAMYDMLKANGKLIPPELAEMIEGVKPNKYHNTKTYQDGRVYDSAKEAVRAGELKLLVKAGELVAVFEQVPFPLAGGVKYIADFLLIHQDGRWTVEDVKSEPTKTAAYRIKKKLFGEKYGQKIKEV